MGSPAHVHGLWAYRLLRQLAQSPRHRPQPLPPGPPADPVLRTGRRLVVVLHRRPVLRDSRSPAVTVAPVGLHEGAVLHRAEPPLRRGADGSAVIPAYGESMRS